MEFVKLELIAGKRVRDPKSGTYLVLGQVYRFQKSQFWMRRLQDGDVELHVEKKAEVPKPKKKSKKKIEGEL